MFSTGPQCVGGGRSQHPGGASVVRPRLPVRSARPLQRALTADQTRQLASPQNPSGVAIPPVTLREIVQLMQEVCPEAYLLVDETYREAAYTDDPIAESALALGPKVISV